MNEPQDNQMPPPQTGPRGPATPPQAGPQGYGPRYHDGQDPYPSGYGYPPAPGNGPPPWAQQGGQYGGYQDQYRGGASHPPAPGNNPPWAHQDHQRGGHPATYYGSPSPGQWSAPPGYGAHPGAHAYPSAYATHATHHPGGLGSFFNFHDERFVKGAITGAALTFLLTNDSVQKNAIKSVVKLWSLFQGGVEEIKERFKDAEAEIKTETQSSK